MTWDASVSRALYETLEAYASPAVARQVVVEALADAGYTALPHDPDELSEFLRGPLAAELDDVLGADVADAVAAHLEPMLRAMRASAGHGRDALASSRSNEGTPPAGSSRSELPAVGPHSTRPPARMLRARPTSRPDLPAIAARPTSRPGFPAVTTSPSTPPRGLAVTVSASTESARAVYPAPHPDTPFAPRTLPSLTIARSSAEPPDDACERPTREPAPRIEPLVELGVVTCDEALVATVEGHFADRAVVIGPSFDALPLSRVVLLDARFAIDALRAPWAPERSPSAVVLWPVEAHDRKLFQALQPFVERVVCAGSEASLDDVVALIKLQLTRPG